MKIGIYAPEHLAVLRLALKFYHPQGWMPFSSSAENENRDTTSFIIYSPASPPVEADYSDLGEPPIYEYRQITDLEGLSQIKDAISSGEISLLLFDSLRSYQIWSSGQESPTLYTNSRFKILDGSIQSVKKCPWINTRNLQFSKLRGEEMPSEPNLHVHESAAHWQDDHDSILLSSNQALISYLVKARFLDTQILHLEHQIPSLNLNLGMCSDTLQLERAHNTFRLAERMLSPDFTISPSGYQTSGEDSLSNPAYSFFARIYDNYMSHVDYELWIRSLLKWQKKYGEDKPRRILELACGTANISGLLVFDGYAVDACDSSWQMLSEAEGKIFRPRLFLRSMTEALPQLDYDLVLCLFDSINYLQKKSEITTLLRNVSKALKPGGLFIFDISTLLNSEENFADCLNFTKDSAGYLVHHAEYEEFSGLQKSHLFHFRKTPLGYELEAENHIQRVYRLPELLSLIDVSPLTLTAIHTTDTPYNLIQKRHSPLDEKYPRLFFVLQREK
ncbi:MAG TPA: class I SAM-dependent methyltransferase [Candidatus Cloacimonadota bacterium]|nr:class I SAM-dependent methyltransferase [Candidatus Cloacimonadota bacterium]